jgi:hypothetical protein
MIISEVPREERTSLRRISKQWHAAATKLGHAFEPPSHEPSVDDRVCDLPMYSPRVTFKHNPAFDSTPAWMDLRSRTVYLGGRIWCQHLSFRPLQAAAQLAERDNEFITDPPITQAKIHSASVSLDVLLQVRGGIRIRDVLEYFRELCYLKLTRVNVLFGDETRRATADRLFAMEGELAPDDSDNDDDSYAESEPEEGEDEDCSLSDSDDDN